MKKIAIYGAGGFGREIALLIEQINQKERTWEIVGFFDDGETAGKDIYGYPVLGGIEALNSWNEKLNVTCAIANTKIKKNIISQINNSHVEYPVLVHPNVFIGHKDVTVGEGCIIAGGTIITVNIHIGKHVILNSNTVGHDARIGDFCSFMPGVNISGEVSIAEGVFAGTGASILNQLSIGEHTTVGAGAVVTKDLPSNCTAVGVPARVIRFGDS